MQIHTFEFSSLILSKILPWLKIRGGWISASETPFLFSSRKKKTPSAKSERHVPSPESISRGFRPNLSTQIAATRVTATYKLKSQDCFRYCTCTIIILGLYSFNPLFKWLFILFCVIKSCSYVQLAGVPVAFKTWCGHQYRVGII